MKTFATIALLLIGSLALAGDKTTFHHCTYIVAGGASNSPHLFDTSELYRCDEGTIELSGQWNQTIEHGYVYTTELGKPSIIEPYKATASDYEWAEWCSAPTAFDATRKVRCGAKPGRCWDGKPATWNPDWQGYSCVTPDHGGK